MKHSVFKKEIMMLHNNPARRSGGSAYYHKSFARHGNYGHGVGPACLILILLFTAGPSAQAARGQAPTPGPSAPLSRTYYINANTGQDTNAGTSRKAPWRTLARVNRQIFKPGDRVLFRAGDIWRGQLNLRGQGTAGMPIRVDSYGPGALPEIDMGRSTGAAVSVINEGYWEIRHLCMTSTAAAKSAKGPRVGVLVNSTCRRILHHIVIAHCVIRHIQGGLSHYDSGGIFVGLDGWISRNAPFSTYHDVTISHNTITDVDRCGIVVWTPSNSNYFDKIAKSQHLSGPLLPSRGVVVSHNHLSNIGGDAILVLGSAGAMVAHNDVHESCLRTQFGQRGNRFSAAVWLHSCSRSVMQFNKVFDSRPQPGNGDAEAFDFDFGCRHCILQYNFSEGNWGGLLLIMGSARDNIVRYNISVNDVPPRYAPDLPVAIRNAMPGSEHLLYLQCQAQNNNLIYNNDFCVSRGVGVIYTGAPYFKNNIFYAVGKGSFRTNGPVAAGQFVRNDYFGPWQGSPPSAKDNLQVNPRFVNIRRQDFRLRANSPLINRGLSVADNGGRDYFGRDLKHGTSIGASQGP